MMQAKCKRTSLKIHNLHDHPSMSCDIYSPRCLDKRGGHAEVVVENASNIPEGSILWSWLALRPIAICGKVLKDLTFIRQGFDMRYDVNIYRVGLRSFALDSCCQSSTSSISIFGVGVPCIVANSSAVNLFHSRPHPEQVYPGRKCATTGNTASRQTCSSLSSESKVRRDRVR